MKGIGLGQFIGRYTDMFIEEMSMADVIWGDEADNWASGSVCKWTGPVRGDVT